MAMTKRIFWLWLLLGSCANLFAQISGTVADARTGEPLPFATVYVKNTSTGTTANSLGEYRLELTPGDYELVFQYVGYQRRTEKVQFRSASLRLNVALQEQPVELGEVVVRANAEDPAYPIIRKAIEKRKYYRDQVAEYACNVYMKGNIKFLNAPEKFMGRELGDLGGTLDSTRQGIIYLSESQSKLYYQQPNRFKEIMLSSKVSGNDRGFGFNRASDVDFNLYENTADFSRQIVSPIATNAMNYYRYKLINTFPDEDGRLIYKIELLPRRSEDPVYRGFVYIAEGFWNIQSADLLLLQGSMNQPGLDSLSIRQVYVPVQQPDVWRLFSQHIEFRAGLFGFRLGGTFTGIYSDYDLQPNFPNNFFGNEVFRVEVGANERALNAWDTIRPIPLTEEEVTDYVRKDSLQEVRRSKPYLDSLDAKNNKFKFADIFFGYDYNRSYERRYLSVTSPATTVQYNTVQGWNADLNIRYRQVKDELGIRWWDVSPSVNYGFAEKRLRATFAFRYRFNQKQQTLLNLSGGTDVVQFNPANPIGKTVNTIYSLWAKENYMKLYNKAFGRVAFQQELFNGVWLSTNLEYARRSALVNRSDFNWRRKQDEKTFTSNDPLDPTNNAPAFEPNNALTWGLSLRLRYKQQYITYPDRKFIYGSRLPELWILYRKGINAFGSDVNYDLLALRVVKYEIPMGVLGRFDFNVEAGTFLNQAALQFMDYRHFPGNQTILGNPDRYRNSFLRLPYYEYSTTNDYVQAHVQHTFDGWMLGKVPLLRKLGWTEIFKASYLYTTEQKNYVEVGLGIDNIGWSAFRLFRFDVVWSYREAGKWNTGFVIGVRMPIDEN
jgi:hypothetical protein